jgi:ABC-type polysaccharide/polyol phosphate export permease
MWFVALVAWPALTGIPAFLVALVIGIVLTRAWSHALTRASSSVAAARGRQAGRR